jgi:hypothetical protein
MSVVADQSKLRKTLKLAKTQLGRSFLLQNLFLLGLGLTSTPVLQADPLAKYDFFGYNGSHADAATVAPSTAGNVVTASPLSLGRGLTDAGYLGNTFAFANANQADLAAAIASNDYVAFTVTPTSGRVNLTDISFEEFSRGGATELALTDASGHLYSEVSAPSSDQAGPNALELAFGATGTTISSATQFRIYGFGGPGRHLENGFGNSKRDIGSDFTINGAELLAALKPDRHALAEIRPTLWPVAIPRSAN